MARTMFNVSPNAPADTLELIYGEDSSTGKSSKPTVKSKYEYS